MSTDMRFLKAEIRDENGMLIPGGLAEIDGGSTLQQVQAFEDIILNRSEKGMKTFIDFSAGYYIDKEFIEHLKTVVRPMQDVEKVVFYFLAFIGSMAHNGIIKDDLPVEEIEQ